MKKFLSRVFAHPKKAQAGSPEPEDSFDKQRDLCALIGLTLVELQGIEKLLRSCVGVVFQDSKGNVLDDLRDARKRKRTLGYFLTVLRQKATIDPTFDEVLSNFLRRRNEFVHDLLGNKRFSLTSAAGRRHIRMLLDRLRSEMDIVGKVMMGALMVWVHPEKFENLSKVRTQFAEGTWMGDAEQIFAPHVKKLVQPK